MTLPHFRNILKLLRSIDGRQLQNAGITDKISRGAFLTDPFRWMMQATREDAELVWAIVEARQPGETI